MRPSGHVQYGKHGKHLKYLMGLMGLTYLTIKHMGIKYHKVA